MTVFHYMTDNPKTSADSPPQKTCLHPTSCITPLPQNTAPASHSAAGFSPGSHIHARTGTPPATLSESAIHPAYAPLSAFPHECDYPLSSRHIPSAPPHHRLSADPPRRTTHPPAIIETLRAVPAETWDTPAYPEPLSISPSPRKIPHTVSRTVPDASLNHPYTPPDRPREPQTAWSFHSCRNRGCTRVPASMYIFAC